MVKSRVEVDAHRVMEGAILLAMAGGGTETGVSTFLTAGAFGF